VLQRQCMGGPSKVAADAYNWNFGASHKTPCKIPVFYRSMPCPCYHSMPCPLPLTACLALEYLDKILLSQHVLPLTNFWGRLYRRTGWRG
jgi:hypothetical protein